MAFWESLIAAVMALSPGSTSPSTLNQSPTAPTTQSKRISKGVSKIKAAVASMDGANCSGNCPVENKGPFVNPDYSDTTDSVGNGYCVPLVQQSTSVGRTTTWRPGAKLSDHPDLKPGTAIATFDKDGAYESNKTGNHAAFFVRYEERGGVKGVVIYDQYRERPKKAEIASLSEAELHEKYPEVDEDGDRFRRKQPGERFVPFDDTRSASNNANAFSVITH